VADPGPRLVGHPVQLVLSGARLYANTRLELLPLVNLLYLYISVIVKLSPKVLLPLIVKVTVALVSAVKLVRFPSVAVLSPLIASCTVLILPLVKPVPSTF